jgi:hypothetical protein
MPHVNEDMKSAEECGVHWRPIPNRQCPDYRPRPPVYEYPPPQWPSYEHPSQHHPSTYEHPPHHRPGYEHPSQYHPSNYVHPPPQRLDYEHHPPPAWTEWPHHPPPSFAYYHRSPPPPQSRYPVEQFVYHSSTVPPLPLPLPPSPPPPPPLRPPPVNLVYEVGDSDVLCGKSTGVGFLAVFVLFIFLLFLFSLCVSLSHPPNHPYRLQAVEPPSVTIPVISTFEVSSGASNPRIWVPNAPTNPRLLASSSNESGNVVDVS